MTAYGERVFSRPDCLNNLHARILSVGVDPDQSPTGAQAASQWGDDALGAEINSGFRAIGLGCDNQVEIGLGPARPRNDLVEQEAVVLTIDYQGYRPLIKRHARTRADAGAPVLFQKRAQIRDLSLELARRGPPQAHFMPDRAGGCR